MGSQGDPAGFFIGVAAVCQCAGMPLERQRGFRSFRCRRPITRSATPRQMRTIRATRSGQVLGRPTASSAAPTNEATDSRKSRCVPATFPRIDLCRAPVRANALRHQPSSLNSQSFSLARPRSPAIYVPISEGCVESRLGQCAAGQRRVELPLSPTDAVPLGLAVASEEHLLHRIAKRRRHGPDQVGYTRS